MKHLPPRLLIGLSGGADSVALLLLLRDSGAQLTAVHVNHGLRGEASDGDEAFVRELCAGLDVPLICYRAQPPENPGENWAREARYSFFRQAMQDCGADALALAHHRDDQAETLLLHLLRGAGLKGLCGMAEDTMAEGLRILRPLLNVSRADLRAWLNQRGQTWREDASNTDPRYLRNAVRGELLPLMERLAHGAAERIAGTCRLLAEDESVLDSLTAQWLAEHPGNALPLETLRAQLPGLQRRILRGWWTRQAAPTEERSLSAAQTEALLSLLGEQASCNLPGGWRGQSGWTHIHLIPADAGAELPEETAAVSALVRIEDFTGDPGDGQGSQAIPREWLAECTVRSRRQGDFIRPFGFAGRQSLQDYFVNRRIDAAFRDDVPLLCRGSEVLLVGGVGAGGVPHTEEISNPVLLRWQACFPWQRRRKNIGGNQA